MPYQVRPGNILELKDRLVQVIKFQHSQGAGRQLGFVLLQLRDLLAGTRQQLKLRPSDTLEVVRLEEKKYQVLYMEDDMAHMMDLETFEQVAVEATETFGTQAAAFLKEGMTCTLSFHSGAPVAGEWLEYVQWHAKTRFVF
jgi:elongation factor P